MGTWRRSGAGTGSTGACAGTRFAPDLCLIHMESRGPSPEVPALVSDMNQLRNDKEASLLVAGLAQGGGNDLVRFIARRLRSVADARDLAHEAYVRLLRVKRKDLIRDPQA